LVPRASEVALRGALYGAEHPYARGLLTEESLGRIDGASVAAFERAHHVAGNATLILVGRFDPELLRKHVVYHLPTSRRRSEEPEAPPLASEEPVASE
jgi:predicted Zn-dependent peptidase